MLNIKKIFNYNTYNNFSSFIKEIFYKVTLLPGLIFYNVKKLGFLLALWFHNNFIKIIPLWKRALYYNWMLYVGSVIIIICLFFHTQFLLYDWFASHAFWHYPIFLRKKVMVFWIAAFLFFTAITFFSSFFYEFARHWKFYGETAYGGYLFYYCLYVHWYYWEHELDYVEKAVGYSLLIYLILLGGMIGGEWEEELDEDWDDAGLHNSRIAQDRGVAYIDKTNPDEYTDEDILMLHEMGTTTKFQETMTDYFGNAFDMSEDVEDTLNNYQDWEKEFFPELHVILTADEELALTTLRMYLNMPVTYEDHIIFSIFSKWDSKENWISPRFSQIIIFRAQNIKNFFLFFWKIFKFFFDYLMKIIAWIYKEQLRIKGNYKRYFIRAVGPYEGYAPKFQAISRPNMTIEVVIVDKWYRPFLTLFFPIKRFILYYLKYILQSIKKTMLSVVNVSSPSFIILYRYSLELRELNRWSSQNYKFFFKPKVSLNQPSSIQNIIFRYNFIFNWFIILFIIIINIFEIKKILIFILFVIIYLILKFIKIYYKNLMTIYKTHSQENFNPSTYENYNEKKKKPN